jgi:hypothetical protein
MLHRPGARVGQALGKRACDAPSSAAASSERGSREPEGPGVWIRSKVEGRR